MRPRGSTAREAAVRADAPGVSDELACDHDVGCITCGDRAEPLEVLKVDGRSGLAVCANADGLTEVVEIALVGPVTPGDTLLVHAGTAIA